MIVNQMNHVHLPWIHSSNTHLSEMGSQVSTPASGKGMTNPVVEFWHGSEKPAVIIPKAILLFRRKRPLFCLFFFQSISLNRVPHTGLQLETLHVLASRIAKVVGKFHQAWFQTFFIFAVYVCMESENTFRCSSGATHNFPLT